MISGIANKAYDMMPQIFAEKSNIDFSQIIVPFSNNEFNLFYNYKNTPFKKLHPEFQLILRKEFANALNL